MTWPSEKDAISPLITDNVGRAFAARRCSPYPHRIGRSREISAMGKVSL